MPLNIIAALISFYVRLTNMLTMTLQEIIFCNDTEAFNYARHVQSILAEKLSLYRTLNYDVDQLYNAFCFTLDNVPLYHSIELSLQENSIKVNLEVSTLNRKSDLPIHNCGEILVIFCVADFLKEQKDNGCLAYDPAEGF